jgi:hypothetical protein
VVAGVTAMAMIAPALGSISYERREFTVPDNSQQGEDARCDRGLALGGGVKTPGGYDELAYVNTSRPGETTGDRDDAWTVYVDNYVGGPGNVKPVIHVVCDTKTKASDLDIYTGSVAVTDGTEDSIWADCDPGEKLVGGGANSTGFYADESYLSASGPSDGSDADQKPDDSWAAELSNDEDGGGGAETLGVVAICTEKTSGDWSYPTSTPKVADGKLKSATATCPKGKRLIGGGVATDGSYDAGLYITSSYPKGDGWTGAIANYDTPDDEKRPIRTTAICRG